MGARELLADLNRDGFSITADGDRLLIRPASKLTDELVSTIRTAKPELLALLAANDSTNDPTRTCRGCSHLLRYGTCGEPREAGLLDDGESFGIRWAPAGYAATCPAFAARVRHKAPERRPYRLSKAEGDAAHAEPWDDAAIARFVGRVSLLIRRGFNATDADDLAERLHLRDVQGDERRLCVECRHLAGRTGTWRCGNARIAGVGHELPAELATTMQRCAGFTAAEGG